MNTSNWLSTSDERGGRDLQGTHALHHVSASPLFPVATGLIGGILLDHYYHFPLWMYLFLLVLATALCFSKRVRHSSAFFLVLMASVGVGGVLYFQCTRADDPTGIERLASTEGVIVSLSGTIVSQPILQPPAETPFSRWNFKKDRSVFLLEVDAVVDRGKRFEATGLLRVSVYEPVLDQALYDRVSISGRLYTLQPPDNPGEFDWSEYYRRMGVVARMVCPHRENIQPLTAEPLGATEKVGWLQQRLMKIRRNVRGLLTDEIAVGGDEPSSLADAMILGQRSKLEQGINDVFFRAGCMHFLAVSGLHLAIPMSFVWLLGRLFSIPKRKCAILLMLTILAYLFIAEPRPSILRASVMGLLFAISILLGRSRSSLNWLSAAAIVLLLYSPVMLFDLGFQLSFLSLLGIVYLSSSFQELWHLIHRWIRRVVWDQSSDILGDSMDDADNAMGVGWTYRWYRMRHGLVRFFVFPIIVGLGAWLATLPIVTYQFHFLHVWSPINSVLVAPLVYLFVMTGLAKIGVGMVLPGTERWLDVPLQWLDSHMIRFVDFLGTLPGSSTPVTSPPTWWIVSYYALLILFVCRFRRPPYKKTTMQDVKHRSPDVSKSSRIAWLNRSCVAALLLFVISTTLWSMPRRTADRLTVTALSVGAGSATVIELPDGRVMMFDAGSLHWPTIGRSTAVPFLYERGIQQIDRVYLSHANLDHYNGLLDIVDAIPVKSVAVNEYFMRKNEYSAPVQFLLDQLREHGISVETIESRHRQWSDGDVIFEYLWPVGEHDESLSNNDSSTVLKLTYKDHSILLTGDIEDRGQRGLLANDVSRSALRGDVLLLPHHGSIRPSTEEFFEVVGASTVIRSSHDRTGANGGGSIVQLVNPSSYFNTADHGAVTVTIDVQGLHVDAVHTTNIVH